MTISEPSSPISTERVPACEVCGSERASVLHDGVVDTLFGAPLEWRYVTCEGCGTVRLDPRPEGPGFAQVYTPAYSTRKRAVPARGRGRLRRRIAAAVRGSILATMLAYPRPAVPGSSLLGAAGARIPFLRDPTVDSVMGIRFREGGRLLDVGCGVGQFLGTMTALGWNAVGTDTDERVVDICRERGLDARVGTLDENRFPDGHFDVVTMRHVIEHVPRPHLVLAEVARILRPGGQLVLITPNVTSLGHATFGRHWLGLDVSRHVNLFTPQSLVALLRTGGLTCESIDTNNRITYFVAKVSHANARCRLNAYTTRPPLASVLYARWMSVRTRFGLWRRRPIGEEMRVVATR